MFGSIGLPELILIFVVALLLFGPRKLPDIGRSLGRALGEFRRASNDLKRTLEEEVASDQLREVGKEVRSAVSLATEEVRGVQGAGTGQAVGAASGGQGEKPANERDDRAPAVDGADSRPLEPR